MKNTVIRPLFFTSLLFISGLVFFGCSDAPGTGGSTSVSQTSSASPTEAYKELFAAVKSQDTEKIKSYMTAKTRQLAEVTAARYQEPVEKVYANAFTTTVQAASLPTIREERIKENMGAIEVWDTQASNWQEVPFKLEDGGWKLAFGDMLSTDWVSPGEGRAARERREANTSLPSPTDGVKPMPSISEGMKKMQDANANRPMNSNANTSSANVNATPGGNK